MIYVLELLAQREPTAWFAYDEEDLVRKVAALGQFAPEEIYDTMTPRELLEFSGPVPDASTRERYPSLCAIGDAYGWDTTLYRADCLLGRGVCQREPVARRDAVLAALAVRGECIVYWNDRDAVGAFEGADPRIAGEARWHARRALYEQLVALEVLADDN